MGRTVWISVLAFLIALPAALGSDGDKITYCKFGPRTRIYAEPESPNQCGGGARIQTVLWECLPPYLVPDRVEDFKTRVLKEAESECSKHCERLASGCRGKFYPKLENSRMTDQAQAVAVGREFGCQASCSGQAFAYFSLYDAGFVTRDAEVVKKDPPNCICEKK